MKILEVCVSKKVPSTQICHTVAQAVQENAVFVLDIKNSVDHRDLTADDNGVYTKHSSPCEIVRAVFRENGAVDSLKTAHPEESSVDGKIYKVQRKYSWHHTSKDFCQIIAKVESEGVLARYAIVQFKAPQDASLLSLKAHGNSNKKSEPYYRIKPSVLRKVKATAQASETPKHIVSAIEQEAVGVLNVSSPADIMRNREQVYNAGRNVEEKKKKVATPACHFDQILSNS